MRWRTIPPAERVDVGIPDYVYESADGLFAGYRLLPGRELDAATFGRLSDTARARIAEQLATFLTAVHETPKLVARECGVPEQDPRRTTRTSFVTSKSSCYRVSHRTKSRSSVPS